VFRAAMMARSTSILLNADQSRPLLDKQSYVVGVTKLRRYKFHKENATDRAAYDRIIEHMARVYDNVDIDGERYFYLDDDSDGFGPRRAIKQSDVRRWSIIDPTATAVISPGLMQEWLIDKVHGVTIGVHSRLRRVLEVPTRMDRNGDVETESVFPGFLAAARPPAGIRAGFLDAC